MKAFTSAASQVRASVSLLARCHADLRLNCGAAEVHAMRVAVRRLRALLWSLKPWIRRDRYRPCSKRLKAIGAELGPLRNADVIGPLVLTRIASKAQLSGTEKRILEADIRRQRIRLGREFRANHLAPYLRRTRRIQELLTHAGLFRRSVSMDRDSWRRRVLRGVKDLERESKRATRKDLHRIRLLAKRCRYSLEALGPDAPRSACRSMRALQTSLGRFCDARLTLMWLQDPESLHDVRLRQRLLRETRAFAERRARAALRNLRKRYR